MKNYILTIAMALSPCLIFAQEKPKKQEVSIEINTSKNTPEKIISAEKEKMKAELKLIDELYAEKKLSAEEVSLKKAEIAKRYEKKINSDIFILNQINNSIATVKINDSIVDIKVNIDSTKVKKIKSFEKTLTNVLKRENTFDKGGLSLTYGFLNLGSHSNYNPFATNNDLRYGNTHSFELKYSRVNQLFGKLSPVLFEYGFAYRTDTYMPKFPHIFAQTNNDLYLKDFEFGSLKRSKLRNVYLLVPVDFHFLLNPKTITVKGVSQFDAKHKNNFIIGLGVYAGIRTRTINKVKYYERDGGDFNKYQEFIETGVENFLFGAKLSIHYRFLNLYVKKDFTPIFNNQTQLSEKNAIQFGIDVINVHF